MDEPLNPELVGREFDKWLDWNGTADQSDSQHLQPNILNTSRNRGDRGLPISPISTANSDSFSLNAKQTPHTAFTLHDLPTPTHSSGSPEILATSAARLSGETAADDESLFRHNKLKRKLSSSDMADSEFKPLPAKAGGSKRPHNVIEKRYRANLNEKIAELRDSVPALRALKKSKGKNESNSSSGEEDLEGLTPSNKLNKASVLTKAVEYIRHMESRTKKLEEENRALKDRLQTLDKVIAEGGDDSKRVAAFTSTNMIEPSPSTPNEDGTPSSSAKREIKGLIGLPEDLQRLRESQPQEHYGHIYDSPAQRSRFGGKWSNRIMLGSLAGLMVMEGFSESDHGDRSREKALFGIPLEILDGWTFLRSPRAYLSMFAAYCRSGGILPMAKGFLALTILAFLIFAYMFNSKPAPRKRVERTELDYPQSARPSSPIEVRRRAWSTSMQALHLPHHSFFPEWLAVTSEWINYSIRYWIGPDAYRWLTGLSAEDEVARVKAWDIAIDAQLAGGDTEVSRSRTVLTIFGSGTLPLTPLRLMMKAIHTRTVLWNVGLADTLTARAMNYIATLIADRQWRRARLLHEDLPARDPDRLPGYLTYLLQMECDEVLSPIVTQRAFNLMYDRPTSDFAEDALMDVVVEDHGIRSPLDAIAAWCSTSALQEALGTALQSPDASDLLREHIQAALEIAPPGSAAETRALAVHAVLSPGRRHAFYVRAADAMSSLVSRPSVSGTVPSTPGISVDEHVPFFIDSSTPICARPEIAVCLSCAQIMLKLEQDHDVAEAVRLFSQLQWPEADADSTTTLLTIAPLYFTLHRLLRAISNSQNDDCPLQIQQCTPLAQSLYHHLRVEVSKLNLESSSSETFARPAQRNGSKVNFNSALDMLYTNFDTRTPNATTPSTPLVGAALATPLRRHSNASNDTGYGSLEDEESRYNKNNITKEGHTMAKTPSIIISDTDALSVAVTV